MPDSTCDRPPLVWAALTSAVTLICLLRPHSLGPKGGPAWRYWLMQLSNIFQISNIVTKLVFRLLFFRIFVKYSHNIVNINIHIILFCLVCFFFKYFISCIFCGVVYFLRSMSMHLCANLCVLTS